MIDEANRIKERLRKCKTAPEIEAVADEERDAVEAMADQEGEGKTMAIQISKLKAYRLWLFKQADKSGAHPSDP